MYCPYLYARGSELLALRDLVAKKIDVSTLLPIIEPVKGNTTSLVKCLETWGNAHAKNSAIVICNPSQIDFHTEPRNVDVLNGEISSVFSKYPSLIKGVLVNAGHTKSQIDSLINGLKGNRIALLYNNPTISDHDFGLLMADLRIDYHVVLNNKVSSMQHSLIPISKFININDNFNKLGRNADYSVPEPFSDEYKKIGTSFIGVGDYTITGRVLELGGGQPSAVAAHLIYKHPANSNIWIEHFVSNDITRGSSDVATKFLQVAKKIVTQASARKTEFGYNIGLQYYNNAHVNSYFPGLPKNKEYQMIHHMCLMMDVISGRL
ncbi:sce7725 family protein [Yersinia enterocolitica]|uniref:sce7725 family protein n=1 Tax=Yersinia enterocolitica TaxID=630 RepID=UPI00285B885E|nr:hypothetical protein [Yersinia enterocolitica]HDL7918910.1 sce7725 family protein [Yersinia enterocolitica]HDV5950486.1 sce7725 family protein [Yersinia enterocolitica]HDV7150284.1 sce7725 family protein [Yersinia enterocolitica]